MNNLSPNRILQEGDEYLKDGAWQRIPEKDIGIQILFTKYDKVRRPSEPEHKPISPAKVSVTRAEGSSLASELTGNRVAGEPISPDSEKPRIVGGVAETTTTHGAAIVTAKAEGNQVTRPLVAQGAGERLSPTQTLIEAVNKANEQAARIRKEMYKPIEKQLPEKPYTHEELVTPKPLMSEDPKAMTEFHRAAHLAEVEAHVAEKLEHHKGQAEKAIAEARRIARSAKSMVESNPPLHLKFPATKEKPLWTGRNGTFGGVALDMHRIEDRIAITPHGKRGAGNCIVEFPVACIPQIIEWLTKQ